MSSLLPSIPSTVSWAGRALAVADECVSPQRSHKSSKAVRWPRSWPMVWIDWGSQTQSQHGPRRPSQHSSSSSSSFGQFFFTLNMCIDLRSMRSSGKSLITGCSALELYVISFVIPHLGLSKTNVTCLILGNHLLLALKATEFSFSRTISSPFCERKVIYS